MKKLYLIFLFACSPAYAGEHATILRCTNLPNESQVLVEIESWNNGGSDRGLNLYARLELNGQEQNLFAEKNMPIPRAGESFVVAKKGFFLDQDRSEIRFRVDPNSRSGKLEAVQYRGIGGWDVDFRVNAKLICSAIGF